MIDDLVKEAEEKLQDIFKEITDVSYFNSKKVLDAFHKYKVSESHFAGTTGYGYGDLGRDVIEQVYAEIFKTEDALVRNQFISGTHALTVALFGILRPSDTLLSITGKPYDTLDAIIGFNDNPSSLKAFGVKYEQIDLKNDDFDEESILKRVKKGNIKLIAIQRSKGYSLRKSLDITSLERIIKKIKEIDEKIIIMVDNCYCEFVSKVEPSQVGADLCVGSLIKNLGGGIATNGAYIVGRKDLIKLCSERLNMPGEAKDVGASLRANKMFLQGLYMAPSVVASSLKTVALASYILEKLGFKCEPAWQEKRADIVELIYLKSKENLIAFATGIQEASAIDAHVLPVASSMPGYDDEIIMASGSFTQGSSIELSCDAPLKDPYVLYLQGSLTYEYGKIGVINAIKKILKD